ncbi:hypothetical protein RB195_000445 [Necator americanus]
MESLATTIRFAEHCPVNSNKPSCRRFSDTSALRLAICCVTGDTTFHDDLNALMSNIPSGQVVIVGIDANPKMELEQ